MAEPMTIPTVLISNSVERGSRVAPTRIPFAQTGSSIYSWIKTDFSAAAEAYTNGDYQSATYHGAKGVAKTAAVGTAVVAIAYAICRIVSYIQTPQRSEISLDEALAQYKATGDSGVVYKEHLFQLNDHDHGIRQFEYRFKKNGKETEVELSFAECRFKYGAILSADFKSPKRLADWCRAEPKTIYQNGFKHSIGSYSGFPASDAAKYKLAEIKSFYGLSKRSDLR